MCRTFNFYFCINCAHLTTCIAIDIHKYCVQFRNKRFKKKKRLTGSGSISAELDDLNVSGDGQEVLGLDEQVLQLQQLWPVLLERRVVGCSEMTTETSCFICSTSLPLASTSCVWLKLSSLCPLCRQWISATSREKVLGTLRIEPRATGCKAKIKSIVPCPPPIELRLVKIFKNSQ